jgi:hypothetical protein
MKDLDHRPSAIESLGIEHYLDGYDDCLRNGIDPEEAAELMLRVCSNLLSETHGPETASRLLAAAASGLVVAPRNRV